MRGSKTSRRYPGFLERRRARQGGDSPRSRAYTFELAALHVQLLVAMAAVDEQVVTSEVDEVLAVLDRTSLDAKQVARLEQLARASLAQPPQLDALMAQLQKIAGRHAVARMVVDDLARVAAADSREDPRETRMLDEVCDALRIDRIRIPIEPASATGGASSGRAPVRGPRLVARHRARTAVRRALEESYRDPPAGR